MTDLVKEGNNIFVLLDNKAEKVCINIKHFITVSYKDISPDMGAFLYKRNGITPPTSEVIWCQFRHKMSLTALSVNLKCPVNV